MIDGVLRNPVPPADRPTWWPTDLPGVEGYAIHPLLEDTFGTTLARGSDGVAWPPTEAQITQLEQLVLQLPSTHPLWFFWTALEHGDTAITPRTHDTGHNFVGGHMSGGFSPNDPIFWLHHSNVDRLWANWQARRLNDVPGSKPEDHYPPAHELSPFTLTEAPPGHRLDDQMWPWVGGAPGFDTAALELQVKPLLPDFSGDPGMTVRETLETVTIDAEGYRYAPPAP